jgi:hypothetical protein
VFVPMEQGRDTWNQLFLVAKIAGDAMSAVPALRQAVVSIDPDQPVCAFDFEQAFETSILPQRFNHAAGYFRRRSCSRASGSTA